jgi:predicted Zn-dependent protease
MAKASTFCGTHTPRRLIVEAAAAAWRKRSLTYWVAGSLPGVSSGTFEQTAAEAFAAWSRVTPLDFRPAQRGETPDVVMTAGRIDQAGGVLAWSELPDGSDRQLTQKYDTSERYVVSATPGRGEIDLLAVMEHEIGHALGLDHAAQNAPDLMAPTYRPGLRSLQPGDVRRIQGLYGKRDQIPPQPGAVKRIALLGVDGKEVESYEVVRASLLGVASARSTDQP